LWAIDKYTGSRNNLRNKRNCQREVDQCVFAKKISEKENPSSLPVSYIYDTQPRKAPASD